MITNIFNLSYELKFMDRREWLESKSDRKWNIAKDFSKTHFSDFLNESINTAVPAAFRLGELLKVVRSMISSSFFDIL